MKKKIFFFQVQENRLKMLSIMKQFIKNKKGVGVSLRRKENIHS